MSTREASDPTRTPTPQAGEPTSRPEPGDHDVLASAASPASAHRRRRTWWVAAAAAVVLVALVVALATWRSSRPGAAAAPVPSLPIAEVQRGTLTASESRPGTIAYADAATLTADVVGRVTWLPRTGLRRTRGETLARIDEQRVIAMYGRTPAFRTMTVGNTGRDVAQLEENLTKLGYSGFDEDRTYTTATAGAVRQWQEDVGLPVTGTVQLGHVTFLSGAVQVGAMAASVGDRVNPGSSLYAISSTGRVVSVTLAEEDRDLAIVGATVRIDAGSAGNASGSITSVEAHADTSGTVNQTPTSTDYVVTITIDADSEGAQALGDQPDGASVTVDFSDDSAEDVLYVPVKALLALAEGGYGLEIVRADDTTSIVAVTTGLFADGNVEVAGDQLAAGVEVRTAR